MSKSVPTFTAICLCAAISFARPSLAAPPVGPDPRTVRLHVDVDELGDKGIGLGEKILEHIEPRIAAANFRIVEDDADAATVLRIRFHALKSSQYDYGVHFEFVQGDSREPAIEWVDCHMCVDARLIPVLDEQLPALLLALDERAEELRAAGSEDRGGEPEPVEPMPRPITGLGIGGSIVAALGVGALIGGSVELSRGVVTDVVPTEQRKVTDHRPPGYTLVGVGATALVVGLAMLGVDLAAHSKARKARAQNKRAHVFPLLAPGRVGLGISGRF